MTGGNVRELENCLERTYALPAVHRFTPGICRARLPRYLVSSPPMAMGHSDGRPKIIPIAELEKQTILSAIAELKGDKLQAARLLGQDTSLPQAEGDYATRECQS
jgi:DNA-binding NtrC family response regulator